MTNLPYSLAKELVADHQRELERSAARWRLRRRTAEPVATLTTSTVALVTRLPAADDHQTTAAA